MFFPWIIVQADKCSTCSIWLHEPLFVQLCSLFCSAIGDGDTFYKHILLIGWFGLFEWHRIIYKYVTIYIGRNDIHVVQIHHYTALIQRVVVKTHEQRRQYKSAVKVYFIHTTLNARDVITKRNNTVILCFMLRYIWYPGPEAFVHFF